MTSDTRPCPQQPRRTRHTASTITDPELDRLYSELDQYHLLLAAIGLPPGVVPARQHPAPDPG